MGVRFSQSVLGKNERIVVHFKGKTGLYLEDMYIESLYQGKNIEKILMDALRKECKEQNLGRFEW